MLSLRRRSRTRLVSHKSASNMQTPSYIVVAVAYSLLLDVVSVQSGTTTEKVRFCGGHLAKALSLVCSSFNSPHWDITESSSSARIRAKRDYGISDQCCTTVGCSLQDLHQYCADDYSANAVPEEDPTNIPERTESQSSETSHVIEGRSVEARGEGGSFRSLFGASEVNHRDVSRSAPVVGTVSPLLSRGRALHDMQSRERLLYVTV